MNLDHKAWEETEKIIVKNWSEGLDIQEGYLSSNWFRAIKIPQGTRKATAGDIIKEKLGLNPDNMIMLFKEDYTQCKIFERNAIANWNHFPWNPIWERKWKIPEIHGKYFNWDHVEEDQWRIYYD